MNQHYTKVEIDSLLETIKNQLNPYEIWAGTQQEYDSLVAKGNNTLYFVRGNKMPDTIYYGETHILKIYQGEDLVKDFATGEIHKL